MTYQNNITLKDQIIMAAICFGLAVLLVVGYVRQPSTEQQTKQLCDKAVAMNDQDSLAACRSMQEKTNTEYLCKDGQCWLELK